VSLKHKNEVLAWIADRKRNYPTQERITARKAAEKLAEKQNREYQTHYSGKDVIKSIPKENILVPLDAASDSDNDAPEVIPIRKEDPSLLPAKENNSERSKTPCKYFLRDGYCRRRDCRFLHENDKKIARQLTLMEKVSLNFPISVNSQLTILSLSTAKG
jgi:hypothetical protein